MGITETLTVTFIFLKIFHIVAWSWWIVFVPEIIALIFYVAMFFVGVYATNIAKLSFDERFDNMFK